MSADVICPDDDCDWKSHGSIGRYYNYCPLCGEEIESG